MGVVAVRDTYVTISKQMVSIAERMTSAVTVSSAAPASATEHAPRATRQGLGVRGTVDPDRGPIDDDVRDPGRLVRDQPLTVGREILDAPQRTWRHRVGIKHGHV